jgi:hypothetical protein
MSKGDHRDKLEKLKSCLVDEFKLSENTVRDMSHTTALAE